MSLASIGSIIAFSISKESSKSPYIKMHYLLFQELRKKLSPSGITFGKSSCLGTLLLWSVKSCFWNIQGDGISENCPPDSLFWKNLAGRLNITSIWYCPFSKDVKHIFWMLLKWISICNCLSNFPSFLKPGALYVIFRRYWCLLKADK